MLSDSCFECLDQLLESIAMYHYSDDHRNQLLRCIMELNEVRDELDSCINKTLLKNNRLASIRIATKLYENAVKKRHNSLQDIYEEL